MTGIEKTDTTFDLLVLIILTPSLAATSFVSLTDYLPFPIQS